MISMHTQHYTPPSLEALFDDIDNAIRSYYAYGNAPMLPSRIKNLRAFTQQFSRGKPCQDSAPNALFGWASASPFRRPV